MRSWRCRRPGSTSTSRSASRSARTATSWSSPARPRRGPANRIAAFVAALQAELALRADDLDARFGPPGSATRPPLDTVYLGGGTPTLLPPTTIAGAARHGPSAVRDRGRRRGHDRGQPGPGRARRRGRPGSVRHQPDLVRRPEPRFGRAATARSPPSARPRRRRRRRRPASGGIGSVNLDLLYDVPDGSLATWIDTLEAALELRPGSPVALRPDPRRPRRRGPDRRRRRPPPDDPRSPPLARPRDPRPGRGSRRRPVPPRRRIGSRTTAGAATRSATGPAPATRAATTSATGSAGRTRRSGPGPTPSTGRPDAGTPPTSDATSER